MTLPFGSARVRTVLLATLLVIAAAIYGQFLFRKATSPPAARRLGASVFDTPDTHGTVPGNPERAERQMRDLYADLQVFLKRHGRPPRIPSEFVREIQRNFDYPFAFDDLLNPDCRYADAPQARHAARCFPYILYHLRPDGQPLLGPKREGTRDVLAMTDIYFHKNRKNPARGTGSWAPVGFFLVLWEDGEVTRVPFDNVLLYKTRDGGEKYAFPGQAGVPATAVGFREHFKRLRRRGPGEQ